MNKNEIINWVKNERGHDFMEYKSKSDFHYQFLLIFVGISEMWNFSDHHN